jgi:hypothetical protein
VCGEQVNGLCLRGRGAARNQKRSLGQNAYPRDHELTKFERDAACASHRRRHWQRATLLCQPVAHRENRIPVARLVNFAVAAVGRHERDTGQDIFVTCDRLFHNL